jgi:hypothetical protein
MEDVGKFYGHFVNFRSFGTFYDHLEYFHPLWYVVPRKIWQPCSVPTAFLIVYRAFWKNVNAQCLQCRRKVSA